MDLPLFHLSLKPWLCPSLPCAVNNVETDEGRHGILLNLSSNGKMHELLNNVRVSRTCAELIVFICLFIKPPLGSKSIFRGRLGQDSATLQVHGYLFKL